MVWQYSHCIKRFLNRQIAFRVLYVQIGTSLFESNRQSIKRESNNWRPLFIYVYSSVACSPNVMAKSGTLKMIQSACSTWCFFMIRLKLKLKFETYNFLQFNTFYPLPTVSYSVQTQHAVKLD